MPICLAGKDSYAGEKMDWTIQPEAIDALFSSTISNTQDRLDALAGTVLGQGIDH